MFTLSNGIAWVERLARGFERMVEAVLKKKEEVLIPFFQNFWPRWLTANRITGARLLAAMAIIPWILLDDYRGNIWLAVVFTVALLSDFLDGPIARALGQTSSVGSLLDKIADKVLVVPLGIVEFWPYDPWLVICSLTGTLVILFLAFVKFFRSKKTVVPENTAGKLSMVCYSLAVLISIWPQCQLVADRIAWGGLFVGLGSVLHNFHRYFIAASK